MRQNQRAPTRADWPTSPPGVFIRHQSETDFIALAHELVYGKPPASPGEIPHKTPPPNFPAFGLLRLHWVATGENGIHVAYGKSRYGNVLVSAKKGEVTVRVSPVVEAGSLQWGRVLDGQAMAYLQSTYKHLENKPTWISKVEDPTGYKHNSYPETMLTVKFGENEDPLDQLKLLMRVLHSDLVHYNGYPE